MWVIPLLAQKALNFSTSEETAHFGDCDGTAWGRHGSRSDPPRFRLLCLKNAPQKDTRNGPLSASIDKDLSGDRWFICSRSDLRPRSFARLGPSL